MTLALFGCSGAPPAGPKVSIMDFTLKSNLLGMPVQEIGLEPAPLPGEARRPLLVLLPGYDMYPNGLLSLMGDSVSRLGKLAPDVILVNGGSESFYHDRSSGTWGSYVLKEAIPAAIRRLGADPSRVAIGGISMGGFGAFDLSMKDPGRFCAVGGHSPAVYRAAGLTPPGAFDDPQDFAHNDIYGRAISDPGVWKMPIWIDVGSSDPFRLIDTEFAHSLKAGGDQVSFHVWPGGHDHTYWSSHMDQYLAFYAHELASCSRH